MLYTVILTSNAYPYTESFVEIAFFVLTSSASYIPFGFAPWSGIIRDSFCTFLQDQCDCDLFFFFLLSFKGCIYCHFPPKHHRTHRKRNRGKQSLLPLLYSCEYMINVCVYRFTLHSGKYIRTGKIEGQVRSSYVLRRD